MSNQLIVKRYSNAFKHKVVSEIESGQLTIAEAKKLYNIGNSTIENWIKKIGKNHLLAKVVRIEMKDEKDRIKELEREKRQLESALAQAHIKLVCYESLIDCAKEELNIDLKKKYGFQQSISQLPNSKNKKKVLK